MTSKAYIITVVIVVILVAAGTAGYYAYSSGLLGHKNSTSVNEAYYRSLALASPGQVNSSLGGGWAQVANMTFATSDMAGFFQEYQSSSGTGSIIPLTTGSPTDKAMMNSTLGNMESFQIADFYSQNQGVMVMGYAHFLSNTSASFIYEFISLYAAANTTTHAGVLQNNQFFYITNNTSLYLNGPKIYKNLLISNYGGEIIEILTVTNNSIPISSVENLLSDEYSILHTYGPVSSSVVNVISQSQFDAALGIRTDNSTNISVYVNTAFISAQDRLYLSMENGTYPQIGSTFNFNQNLSTALYAEENFTSLQLAVYNNKSSEMAGISLATFQNSQIVAEIYDNLSANVGSLSSGTGNVNLTNGTFSTGGKYVIISSSTFVNGTSQDVLVALAYHGDFLFVAGYVGLIPVSSAHMKAVLNAEVSLL